MLDYNVLRFTTKTSTKNHFKLFRWRHIHSTKCDATETGDIEHSIIGVVNDICESEKPILDQNVFSEHYVQTIADAESVDDLNTERHEVEMSIYH
ncbi:hypothetical protein ACLHDG_06685 [Sulfurovum sp. CS9]|uniref:hypothetical protein n=1 Tax=Sulfurovum sp. CS9 TaxID=3391146 RepID=UPI0039EAC455